MTADTPGLLKPDGTYANVRWVIRGSAPGGLSGYLHELGEIKRFRHHMDAALISLDLNFQQLDGGSNFHPVARVPYRRGETRP